MKRDRRDGRLRARVGALVGERHRRAWRASSSSRRDETGSSSSGEPSSREAGDDPRVAAPRYTDGATRYQSGAATRSDPRDEGQRRCSTSSRRHAVAWSRSPRRPRHPCLASAPAAEPPATKRARRRGPSTPQRDGADRASQKRGAAVNKDPIVRIRHLQALNWRSRQGGLGAEALHLVGRAASGRGGHDFD